MKKLIFILFLFNYLIGYAQSKLGNCWVTGYSGNRDFNNNSITTTQGVYFPFKYFLMGSLCISDTLGNLLMASDGYNIYNSAGDYIDNGDTLIPLSLFNHDYGHSVYSQASIFLPMDSGSKYYLITPTMSDVRYTD